jgi:NADH:ubiquinone oxidoreductase subunit E
MNSFPAEIVICMGSSCFSRGNKKSLQIIREFLKEKNIQGQITFKGSHCFGNCQNGPVLKINDTFLEKVDPGNLLSVLEGIFQEYMKG